MKNFGAYLLGVLLLIGLLEILAFVALAGWDIYDFKNEVKWHNSHFYNPHTALVNDTTDKPVAKINPESLVDTLMVNTLIVSPKFMITLADLHVCPICAGRDAYPSWLIRTIWPLFDIKN